METRDAMASLCTLMPIAWQIDGLVKFNDAVQLESPVVKEAYEARRTALLDEARAIRALYAARQEGDSDHLSIARRYLLKTIDTEEQVAKRLAHLCLP